MDLRPSQSDIHSHGFNIVVGLILPEFPVLISLHFFLSNIFPFLGRIFFVAWKSALGRMQSFLQYKRFGKHASDQYDRDRKLAEALERGNSGSNRSAETVGRKASGHRRSSIDETESPTDSRDPEKSEQPGNDGQGVDGYAERSKETQRPPH